MNHSYFIEHDIRILETTCERQDKRKGGVASFLRKLNGLPNPSPMGSRPPPPMAQLVSQCVYLRPAVKICGYPELPSILCFIRLSCDSFSYQDQPDVSQPRKSCLATPSWTNHEIETIMDKSLDQIDTISD